jgi:predicted component of type VI protein secretion system
MTDGGTKKLVAAAFDSSELARLRATTPANRRQGFVGRLAQLPREHVVAEIARNLGFVFNTRKACGSVLADFGFGDYEHEVNTHHAVEALRVELLAAVRRHEPRLHGAAVRLLGRYRYNMVRFEIAAAVDGVAVALGVDIDTTTRAVAVLVAAEGLR